MMLQALHTAITPEAGDGDDYETLYAVDQTKVEAEDIVEVTNILNMAEKPESVVVLIDSEVSSPEVVTVTPTGTEDGAEEGEVISNVTTPEGQNTAPSSIEASPLAASLESIVIAMGGTVVHSFGEYLSHRRR
jgi:hypothetical protein